MSLLAYECFPRRSSSCWTGCYARQPELFLQHNSISALKAHDIPRAESTEWKQQAHPITIPQWGPWHEAGFKLGTGPSTHSVPVPEAICCLTRPGLCWGWANGGSTRACCAQAQWLTVGLIALLSIGLLCSRRKWTLLCVEIKHGQFLENKSLFL